MRFCASPISIVRRSIDRSYMNNLCLYQVFYRFNDEPREHTIESDEQPLAVASAALHLLQLHFGDGENSLIIPSADAAPVEVLRQANLLGIADIRVDAGVETPAS